MKYLLLIYSVEANFAKAVAEGKTPELMAGHAKFQADLGAEGIEFSPGRLQPVATARTLAKDGSLHDGPFAETKEQLGGYYLIDVGDMDAAVAWARKIPLLEGGKVEIRPIM